MSAPPAPLVMPRVLVAGSGSGVGKTTVVVALCRALRRRGLRVATFKCGPDYLDPTWHARASGAPCHNLDGWMMGEAAVRATFARASRGADLALLEGMMGLYDGVDPRADAGSAAEIARWLDAPVAAVVDASGMVRTVAAVASGLGAFDARLRFAGVIANRVGGGAHLDMLRAACASSGAPPIVGGLPGEPALSFPERHLGLRSAHQAPVSDEQLDAWGERAEALGTVEALLAVARAAPPLAVEDDLPPPPAGPRCRIAVADDAAFHFYYEDNLRRLEALGAELVRFSPLADATLPDVDGVYLGGGYPEAHAAELARNASLRASLRAFAAAGGPVYAECGGLMYLARGLRTLDGTTHEMTGLVGGVAVMHPRLQAIGYVELETTRPSLLGPAGTRVRGHQFRHSTLEGAQPGAYTLRRPGRDTVAPEGYAGGDHVLGSYVHAHWASNPDAAAALVDACAAFARRRRR